MAILRVKLLDASGQALTGLTVKVSGCGALQANDVGAAQFLVESGAAISIEINDSVVWTGSSADLSREESFQQINGGFTRLGA